MIMIHYLNANVKNKKVYIDTREINFFKKKKIVRLIII